MDYIKEMRAMMKMLAKEMPNDEFLLTSNSEYKKSFSKHKYNFFMNGDKISSSSDVEEMHDFVSEYVDIAQGNGENNEEIKMFSRSAQSLASNELRVKFCSVASPAAFKKEGTD